MNQREGRYEVRLALIIPTLNGGKIFADLITSLASQTRQPDSRILLDSQSTDDTVKLSRAAGFSVISVLRATFDHGGTRQLGIRQANANIVVFLTQDAVLADSEALADSDVEFGI